MADHFSRRWGTDRFGARPERYRIIDRVALCELLGVAEQRLAVVQNEWIESQQARGTPERDLRWSHAVAVGRRSFVERVQEELGARARYRRIEDADGGSILRDGEEAYRPDYSREMGTLIQLAAFDSATNEPFRIVGEVRPASEQRKAGQR